MKPMILILPIAVMSATALATTYLVYRAAYKFKHGNNAMIPFEARIRARFHRSKLDSELAKILKTPESR